MSLSNLVGHGRHPLEEVMPQYTGGIFVDADIGRYVNGIVLDHRSLVVFPLRSKEFPKLCKFCESPVAFFCVESVLRSWSSCVSVASR